MFNIQIRFSSVSQPQTNGQVESANKEILNGIKKKIEGAKGTWDEELPNILWASRTTIKDAIGHTPFSLVYGSEAVLPLEIGIPSTVKIDSQKIEDDSKFQPSCENQTYSSWRLRLPQN